MSSPDPLVAQLLQLVRALDPITERALDSAHGATLSQLAVLRTLGTETFTVSALGEALGTHRSSTSRMVDRLVAVGLVTKTASLTSLREVGVTATPKGREAAQSVADQRLAALTTLLAPLAPEERAAVAVALDALLRATSSPPLV